MKAEKPQSRFVLCIRNDGADDLGPRKVYQLLSGRGADREGYMCIIDESGEDYLYPAEYFVAVKSRDLASSSNGAPAGNKTRRG